MKLKRKSVIIMKKENKNQKMMMIVLREFDMKNGRFPDLQEICDITEKNEVGVKRILSGIEIYPKEMLLTANEKLVKEIYREGLMLVDLAKITGLCESTISKAINRLADRGLIDYKKRVYKKREPHETDEDKKPYLRVEGGPFNGSRGYIKEYETFNSGVFAICDLWNGGNFIEDAKVHPDYIRETGGRR